MSIMIPQEQLFENLRLAIEEAVGRKMKTPRDFGFLAEAIFEKLHQSVSPSTLKRFWGYLPQYSTTRTSTLDILAQFIDYEDWDAFCREAEQNPGDTEQTVSASPHTISLQRRWYRPTLIYIYAAIMVLLAVGCIYMLRPHADAGVSKDTDHSNHVLRAGQIFESYNDYLPLFGVTNQENFWDCPLPHHEGIIIWSPEYHHPQWHNEGDRDSLCPTITEWWESADSLIDSRERELLTSERNEHLYFTVMRTNELRITFMKNLTDTNYVFLGVYRTDLDRSDGTHIVWERVAKECDIANLAYLEQLRH